MKYQVLKSFIDKNTNKGYNEGSTFESDDLERVSFLSEKGYINGEVKKPQPKKRTRKKASE